MEVDTAVLMKLVEAIGAEAVNEIIDVTCVDAPNRIAEFRAGLERGDLALARRAAHTLKSNAANLGARELTRLCEELETAARLGDTAELARAEPELEQRLARVLTELKQARLTA